MTCRELIDFLMSYLDRELPEPQHRTFEKHLAACPHCTNYVDSYRTVARLGYEVCRSLDDELPPEIPEDLVEAILAARHA